VKEYACEDADWDFANSSPNFLSMIDEIEVTELYKTLEGTFDQRAERHGIRRHQKSTENFLRNYSFELADSILAMEKKPSISKLVESSTFLVLNK
jgi:hypothetical protein